MNTISIATSSSKTASVGTKQRVHALYPMVPISLPSDPCATCAGLEKLLAESHFGLVSFKDTVMMEAINTNCHWFGFGFLT